MARQFAAKSGKLHHVSARVERVVKESLEREAAKEGRSVAAQVRWILRERYKNNPPLA